MKNMIVAAYETRMPAEEMCRYELTASLLRVIRQGDGRTAGEWTVPLAELSGALRSATGPLDHRFWPDVERTVLSKGMAVLGGLVTAATFIYAGQLVHRALAGAAAAASVGLLPWALAVIFLVVRWGRRDRRPWQVVTVERWKDGQLTGLWDLWAEEPAFDDQSRFVDRLMEMVRGPADR